MPVSNRPKRTRLIIILIIIMGRFAQSVEDADTAMQDVCRTAVSLVPATDEVYLVPESAWSSEQAAVHSAATAFCDAFDNGAWPDCTTLGGLTDDWDKAVQDL